MPIPRSCPLRVVMLVLGLFSTMTTAAATPNVVIILADDLGYGDLGSYGHPSIATPNLDRMAAEGMRFTDFYSSAAVCTPSRAGMLTGRYPVRSGMTSDKRRVLFPNSTKGLPKEEITIAEALKEKGYATACVGKWHLGHLPQYLPTSNGFDYYFGVPYSNDMDAVPPAQRVPAGNGPKTEWFRVPLMRNEQELERPANQHELTRLYTEEAVGFIRKNKAKPFFLYLAHTMPHIPLFASKAFEGKSARGLYGDVVEELDWSVGQVLDSLKREGLAENTLVIFTSDNGPWLTQKLAGGSAGLLREGKGSTWEGGMRVPCIAWWPGKVKAGVVNRELACSLDLFSTALDVAGVTPPKDREIDGVSMLPMLLGQGKSLRQTFFFYRDQHLYAVRSGAFKAHFTTKSAYGRDPAEKHEPPLLFHLGHDPSEQFNVAAKHPDVLSDLQRQVEKHKADVKAAPDQLVEVVKQ